MLRSFTGASELPVRLCTGISCPVQTLGISAHHRVSHMLIRFEIEIVPGDQLEPTISLSKDNDASHT